MNIREWTDFIEGRSGNIAVAARLSPSICSLLGAADDCVYIAHEYALKIKNKHNLKTSDFLMLTDTIWVGRILRTSEGRITILHYDEITNEKWFLAGLKVAQKDRKFYITTFHRSNPIQAKKVSDKLFTIRQKKN